MAIFMVFFNNRIEMDAKGLFKQILLGIEYMHENGICHRDLKPHNIILCSDGKDAKITDFNVSKYFRSPNGDYSRLITQTGTMAFNAPEIFSGQE